MIEITGVTFEKLHPSVCKVWRWGGLISWLIAGFILAIISGFVAFSVLNNVLGSMYVAGSNFILCLLLSLWSMSMAKRRYEAWGYALREDDLLIRHGRWWCYLQCIPRLRVQHVDITSGPIDRMLGLVELSVHTAHGHATIPGLTPQVAEGLQRALIATSVPDAIKQAVLSSSSDGSLSNS